MLTQTLHRMLALCLCTLVAPAGLRADVIQWPESEAGNEHWYELVYAPRISWSDAQAAAYARVLEIEPGRFVNGYLATVTSVEEDLWLQANVYQPTAAAAVWLGGFQDPNDPDYSEPAGGWRWITGEPWSYTNWHPGEPNNLGMENYLEANLGPDHFGTWNDIGNGGQWNLSYHYLVEYVPEPATVALMGLGALVLFRRRR